MSEPVNRRSRENLQHQAEHTRSRRRVSVFGYLVILFAAAFLLLGFAYLQQQRQQNAETADALKQSASAVQTIQDIMANNEALRDKVEELEGELKSLQEQYDALGVILSSREQALEKTQIAMDYFWQLDEAYVRSRYTLCRELIKTMEDTSAGTPLKSYLPRESATNNDRFSPADRYQEIRNAVY